MLKYGALCALILGGMLSSCQTIETDVPGTETGEGTVVTETLDVSFGDNDPGTKVDIANYSGKFSWSENDQIAVWYQNGTTGSWSTGTVTANAKVNISGQGKRAKLAVYPAGVQTNFNLTEQHNATYPVTKITYPDMIDFTGKPANYAPMPMIALNDPGRNGLKFFHVGGVVRFKLYGVPAGTMYIKVVSDADPIAGEFPVAIPTGNEVNGAELVYDQTKWSNDFDDPSWDQLFKPSHKNEVLVKIASSALTEEGNGYNISLPVPTGVYETLTISAVNASLQEITPSTTYAPRSPDVFFDCERASGHRLAAQALRPNHPMTLPTTVHGLFRVSETKQVYFASGNVLFIADKSGDNWTNRRWKFADNQWDVYADASNYQDGPNRVIDHFGWGTGNNPWLTADITTPYSTTFTDWGIHFDEVGNGSDSTNEDFWHTPTASEWRYLHNVRPKASILWGYCSIADNAGVTHDGLVYLPDEWVLPAGITFRPGVRNVYSMDGSYDGDWSVLEENGALFLPAASFRTGTFMNTDYLNIFGVYWSTDFVDSDDGFGLQLDFDPSHVAPQGHSAKYYGYSVRLYRE